MAEPNRPLCFVLMPFGRKRDPQGGPDIDFDCIYRLAIKPAIEQAGLEALRADEDVSRGTPHRRMYERLVLSDFAVADLTTANANVFYELGVRHAIRPGATVVLFARDRPTPNDLMYAPLLRYALENGNRFGESEAIALRSALGEVLSRLRDGSTERGPDSPMFQLLEYYKAPEIAHLKTDVFRERASYSEAVKKRLEAARRERDSSIAEAVEDELTPIGRAELGEVVDLFLTYRALQEWDRMIGVFERSSPELKRNAMMREQLGLALNRIGRREDALETLQAVEEERGANSETCSLIGRVYKDWWLEASREGRPESEDLLRNAIEAYLRGFEADWRDAYPGINAATLLDVRGDQGSLARKDEILPVVRFAIKQRMRSGAADYWDRATLLELAVLDDDERAAEAALGGALRRVRERWEPETTAENLELMRTARAKRGAGQEWVGAIVAKLREEAKRTTGKAQG
jgi:tetratricopeptide (TPR) repeat protein